MYQNLISWLPIISALSIIEAKENGLTTDGPMVIIIVSCFAAIVLAASIAGMVCYRKRTRSEISHKVPPGGLSKDILESQGLS